MHNNRLKFSVCVWLFALAFFTIVILSLSREQDDGSEVSLPDLKRPIVLAEGMFFGDMGSVGLRIVGNCGNEITLFYSQPYNSSHIAEKDRLYVGTPPDIELVTKNSNTEQLILGLIEAGLGDLANTSVTWSKENVRENVDFAAKKMQNALRYGCKITD